jgi:nucleotidyltransferase/DNA polymerase involved in DNA repair
MGQIRQAKKAGVKTGMVNWQAKPVRPELITVHPQYDEYIKYSKMVRAIYQRYTDRVEPYGMDECWLDVTGSRHLSQQLHLEEAFFALSPFEPFPWKIPTPLDKSTWRKMWPSECAGMY